MGEKAGGVEVQLGAQGGGEGQRGKIQNGQMGDKRFEDEGGRQSAALAVGGQIVQWRYTSRRSPRRESQCYE